MIKAKYVYEQLPFLKQIFLETSRKNNVPYPEELTVMRILFADY